MKLEGRSNIVILAVIAVVGISGIVEAFPYFNESATELAEDGGLLALTIVISVLLARRFGTRGKVKALK